MALSELAQSLWRGGYRTWNGGSQKPVLVTYSFATDSEGFYEYGGMSILPFTATQQSSVRLALNAWSSVSGLNFIEIPDIADETSVGLRFRISDIPVSYSANSPADTGDITIDAPYAASDMLPGSEAYEILLMTIGYAIGLNVVDSSQTAGTAMARYSASNTNVAALRPADVEAIQYTYGTQQAEDAFSLRWTWDAAFGGIRYDGDDSLQGVVATNHADVIVTRGGDDIIHAQGGNDLIYAGTGDDMVFAGDGNDIVYADDGRDVIDSGLGNDLIYAGAGANTVSDAGGIDTLATFAFRREMALSEIYSGKILSGAGEYTSHNGIENIAFADGRLVTDLGDPVAQVVRVYQAALGRAPDSVGKEYWTAKLNAGAALSDLASSFLNSREFIARFGQPDDMGFIATAYRQALGREADASGMNYWQAQLAGGVTRGEVLAGFSESPENQALTAPLFNTGIWDADDQMANIARLYKAVLGRTPEMNGLRYWDEQADRGASEAQMANLFATSPEFNSRFPGASDVDFVSLVYLNTLGRAPDQDGQTFWLNHLSQGLTRGEMVAGVSHSNEFLTLTTSLTEGGVVFA